MEEQEIELPPYWNKMVEFMPLSPRNLSSKKRRSDSIKKKSTKKPKMPLMETLDDGLENIIPVKDLTNSSSKKTISNATDQDNIVQDRKEIKYDGLEKIAKAIDNFGNVIKTEASEYNSKFENILLNQQKLLELALEQIGKQLSERIDSGMNQIIDILRTTEAGPDE